MGALSIILGLGMLINAPRASEVWEREVVFETWCPYMVTFPPGEDSASLDSVIIPWDTLKAVFTKYGAELIRKHFPWIEPGDTLAVKWPSGDTIRIPDFSRVFIARFPEGSNTEEIANVLESTPGVVYAHPNVEYEYQGTFPNDPLLNKRYGASNDSGRVQWSLYNDGPLSAYYRPDADINAGDPNKLAAWDIYQGNDDMSVAIIDQGVFINHPDLQDRFSIDSEEPDGGWLDYSHGTAIAGIIGANTNNGVGIAGIDWHTQMVARNAGGEWGPNPDRAREAILELCTSDESSHKWVNAFNISFATRTTPSYNSQITLRRVMGTATIQDRLCVTPTGNAVKGHGGFEAYRYPAAFSRGFLWPGCTDGIIAVGASDSEDSVSFYSLHGNHIDLVAPGGDSLWRDVNDNDRHEDWEKDTIGIVSTVDPSYTSPDPSIPDGYAEWIGTSFAVPHVVGAAALLKEYAYFRWSPGKPYLENDDIENILKYTAKDLGPTYGHVPNPSTGYGRLDIYKALSWVKQAIDNNDWYKCEAGTTAAARRDIVEGTQTIHFYDCYPIGDSPSEGYTVTRHRVEIDVQFPGKGRKPLVWCNQNIYHTGYSPGEGAWVGNPKRMANDHVYGFPWGGVVEGSVEDGIATLYTYVYELKGEDIPPFSGNCEDCGHYCVWFLFNWPPLPWPDCPYRCDIYCCYPNPAIQNYIDPPTGSIWIPCRPEDADIRYTVFWPPAGSLPKSIEEPSEKVYPFALYPATPNPFSNTTTLKYSLPQSSHASLKIYNVSGRLVKTLLEGHQDSGIYKLKWDGRDEGGKLVSSGIYFATLITKGHQATSKLILRR